MPNQPLTNKFLIHNLKNRQTEKFRFVHNLISRGAIFEGAGMTCGEDEDFPERVQRLIDLLGEPEEGELNFAGGRKEMSRIAALKELKRLEDLGIINKSEMRGWVNTHVHTNESFSIFRSPTEAVWKAYREGMEIFGINDHYTIAGHKEFREACGILGLKATFSIEALAMCEEARIKGERYNDPENPGRIYLCGKGVIRDLEPGSFGSELLARMRRSLRERYRKMTDKASLILRRLHPSINLTFDDVLKFTPHGNVTERHIAQAMDYIITKDLPDINQRREFLKKLLSVEIPIEDLSSSGKLQDLIRSKLLKAGGPSYVEEDPEAFPSLEEMVSLFREYGAIPTYPVLGNPVTEKEGNLDALFNEVEKSGIYAIEVIPKRNTEERLIEILEAAEKHCFPIFNGTEHNTKRMEPLVDKFSKDPHFLPIFRRGAHLLLGHQFLSTYAGVGYIDEEGGLTFKDRNFGRAFFSLIGRITWSEDTLEWFLNIGRERVFKLALGIYATLDGAEHEWTVKQGFRMPKETIDEVNLENEKVYFTSESAKNIFKNRVKEFFVRKN